MPHKLEPQALVVPTTKHPRFLVNLLRAMWIYLWLLASLVCLSISIAKYGTAAVKYGYTRVTLTLWMSNCYKWHHHVELGKSQTFSWGDSTVRASARLTPWYGRAVVVGNSQLCKHTNRLITLIPRQSLPNKSTVRVSNMGTIQPTHTTTDRFGKTRGEKVLIKWVLNWIMHIVWVGGQKNTYKYKNYLVCLPVYSL